MKVTVRSRISKAALVTLYDVLGCSPMDSNTVLHEAYLELALVLHPDKGGDEEKFKALTLAWGVLKSSERRKQYDAQLFLERKLNCLRCKGTGYRAAWADKKYVKRAKCIECEGKGHL